MHYYHLYESRFENLSISKSDIKDVLSNECSSILNYYKSTLHNTNKVWLYRGKSSDANQAFGRYNPVNHKPRKAANIQFNYYDVFEHFQSWKPWPDRAMSIVGSTDQETADMYGNQTYLIFPTNDSYIGQCPAMDFWESFEYGLTVIAEITPRFSGIDDFFLYYSRLPEEDKPTIDFLDEVFSPIDNGFELFKVEDIDSMIKPNREFWCADESYIIDPDLFMDIVNEI